MSGTEVDPATLETVASTLRNASSELESSASAPPQPEVGVVTGAVTSALAVLTNALGNVVTDVGALGDAVAEGRKVYVETDYEQAAAFQQQRSHVEQPR